MKLSQSMYNLLLLTSGVLGWRAYSKSFSKVLQSWPRARGTHASSTILEIYWRSSLLYLEFWKKQTRVQRLNVYESTRIVSGWTWWYLEPSDDQNGLAELLGMELLKLVYKVASVALQPRVVWHKWIVTYRGWLYACSYEEKSLTRWNFSEKHHT